MRFALPFVLFSNCVRVGVSCLTLTVSSSLENLDSLTGARQLFEQRQPDEVVDCL